MQFDKLTRRDFVTLLGGAVAACPLAARAQQLSLPVIGVLGSASAAAYSERLTIIRQALADAGLTQGRNITMEYRWAEGQLDRLPALAVDLAGRKVNVIIATGGVQAPRAAMSATRTIPIVFSTDSDPVQDGLVASLNRPGGSVTGVTTITTSLTAKRLNFFRDLVPNAKVLAVLVNPTSAQALEQTRDAEETTRALGLESRVLHAQSEAELVPAIVALAGVPNAGLLVSADPFFNARRGIIVAAANRHAIPAIYPRREFAAAGGLISYGANLADLYHLMGTYVARILKGEKPANLPVAGPSKFDLIINLSTAKALGFDVPPKLLALAQEVIE